MDDRQFTSAMLSATFNLDSCWIMTGLRRGFVGLGDSLADRFFGNRRSTISATLVSAERISFLTINSTTNAYLSKAGGFPRSEPGRNLATQFILALTRLLK